MQRQIQKEIAFIIETHCFHPGILWADRNEHAELNVFFPDVRHKIRAPTSINRQKKVMNPIKC